MGEPSFLLTPCVFEQLGLISGVANSYFKTPVSVSGLTSGVVSVALGYVRLFCVILDFFLSIF